MNTKHYVTYDVAWTLKCKGYNGFSEYVYDKNAKVEYYGRNIYHTECLYPMLTFLEAMDWLESKGIHIEIRMMHCKIKGDPYKIAPDDEYQWKWYFVICKGDDVKHPIVKEDEDGYVVMRADRNMCINEAIRKGLDLL